MEWSPSESLILISTESSTGVVNLNGVLLSNIEKSSSAEIIWSENESYIAILGENDINKCKIN